MSKINLRLFFAKNMHNFSRGERVRIAGSEKDSKKIYIIKDMKKIRKGGVLYLLKSLERKSVLRLYYEDEGTILERMNKFFYV